MSGGFRHCDGSQRSQHWCVEVLFFLLPTAYITTLSQSPSSTSNGRDFLAYRFFRQSTMLAFIPTANLTVIWQRHGKQVKKWMLTQRNAGDVACYPLKRTFFNLFFSVFMFLLADWCIAAIWMTVLKTAVCICCACEEAQSFLFWDVIQAALSASWSTLLCLFLPFRVALPCVQNPSKWAFSVSACASRAVVLWGALPLQLRFGRRHLTQRNKKPTKFVEEGGERAPSDVWRLRRYATLTRHHIGPPLPSWPPPAFSAPISACSCCDLGST